MSEDPKDAIIASLTQTVVQLTTGMEKLQAEIAELRRLLFGQKSERLKMPSPERAIRAKRAADESLVDKEARRVKTQEKRLAQTLKKKALPVVEVEHLVTTCPDCVTSNLIDIKSPEISEEIEFVPARFVRRRHKRQKAKCETCSRIITAEAPARVDDGCLWGPGLHAHVVVSKCADAIPLYRLAKRFHRDDMPLPRSSLLRIFHRTASILAPIAARILALVAQSDHVNADETPLPVQNTEKCRQAYMWTFLTESLIGYVFSSTRSSETPSRILDKTQGTLQVDGFSGYNAICSVDGRERVGCLAHVRRKFFVSLATANDDATAALDTILSLYEVEYEAANRGLLGTSEHLAMRKALSQERLNNFEAWLIERQPHHPPKSPMGEAIRYALKALPTLKPILDNPKIRLDNNLAENALRSVALGRKNFLFVADDEGGEHLATLLTVISTCIANDVNPEAYIADVLLRVSVTPRSDLDTLLPQNWTPPAAATQLSTPS